MMAVIIVIVVIAVVYYIANGVIVTNYESEVGFTMLLICAAEGGEFTK